MNGQLQTIDRDRVEETLHEAVRMLTGITDTGQAFESLFPGVHAGSTFAIKVNCIGPTCTRWEMVRGIVSGLSYMLGGTYDVSQVTLFDRDDPHTYGYSDAEFTFNGNHPYIASGNWAQGSGYVVWEDHELSRYILNSDFVIDTPALKSHTFVEFEITAALKNHFGSCHPSDLCEDTTPGMLPLNANSEIKSKTGLVVTDGIRGTFNGDPLHPPQTWSLYDELTPNTLLVTTDPVTNDYWCRDLINAQRLANGYPPKSCNWIEDASEDPYLLGVSDPELMTVIHREVIGVEDPGGGVPDGTYLTRNVPNPFSSGTTLRFRLARPSKVTIEIFETSGRTVRTLGGQTRPAGNGELHWDGRDVRERPVSAGVYVARLTAGSSIHSRRLVVVR